MLYCSLKVGTTGECWLRYHDRQTTFTGWWTYSLTAALLMISFACGPIKLSSLPCTCRCLSCSDMKSAVLLHAFALLSGRAKYDSNHSLACPYLLRPSAESRERVMAVKKFTFWNGLPLHVVLGVATFPFRTLASKSLLILLMDRRIFLPHSGGT